MSMKKILACMVALMVACLAACQQGPKKIPLYTDLGQPIVVTKDQPYFQVQLKANPTTGYSWAFVQPTGEALVQVVSHQYQKPDSNLVGAPGFEIWTFKVDNKAFTQEQTLSFKMDYERPWEKHINNVGVGAGAVVTLKVTT